MPINITIETDFADQYHTLVTQKRQAQHAVAYFGRQTQSLVKHNNTLTTSVIICAVALVLLFAALITAIIYWATEKRRVDESKSHV
jgi:hypothetical protein